MKFNIVDIINCIHDLPMKDDGKIEFTAGKSYTVIDFEHDGYVFIDNSGDRHTLTFRGLINTHFETLTSVQRFDRAMGRI